VSWARNSTTSLTSGVTVIDIMHDVAPASPARRTASVDRPLGSVGTLQSSRPASAAVARTSRRATAFRQASPRGGCKSEPAPAATMSGNDHPNRGRAATGTGRARRCDGRARARTLSMNDLSAEMVASPLSDEAAEAFIIEIVNLSGEGESLFLGVFLIFVMVRAIRASLSLAPTITTTH
jgi:hypothetical protein